MRRVVGLFIAAVAGAGVGCDDGLPRLSSDELITQLEAAGFSFVADCYVPEKFALPSDTHCYVLHFEQQLDHKDATAGTFTQRISLIHTDERATRPMVVYTNGYADTWGFYRQEVTRLLSANQVTIEHRFFGDSRPAVPDWSKLTIEQMADDEHAIVEALHAVYTGPYLAAGASKGGLTAVIYRRFHPTDVVGTLASSAPLTVGEEDGGDEHYQDVLEGLGDTPCNRTLHALTMAMLAKRGELQPLAEALAARDHEGFTRVELAAALEMAITSLDWAFWQQQGEDLCNQLPEDIAALTAEDMLALLEKYSSIAELSDGTLAGVEAYHYQSHTQLGYPDGVEPYIETGATLAFDEEAYVKELPEGQRKPTYDPKAMQDIDAFVQASGDRLLFVYGEWDPWAARRFSLGTGTTGSAVLQVDRGKHGAKLAELKPADQRQALQMLETWTGVAPNKDVLKAAREATSDPSIGAPPGFTRFLRAAPK